MEFKGSELLITTMEELNQGVLERRRRRNFIDPEGVVKPKEAFCAREGLPPTIILGCAIGSLLVRLP